MEDTVWSQHTRRVKNATDEDSRLHEGQNPRTEPGICLETELADIRDVMKSMTEIRSRETTIDQEIDLITERFALLSMYYHEVPADEIEER